MVKKKSKEKEDMKYLSLISLVFTIFLYNCSSEQVTEPAADPREALVKELNKQLEALEIEGFDPDKTTLADKIYNEWAKKGIPGLKEILPKVPEGYNLKVTGHADPYGGEEKAKKIAEGRAKHIRDKVAKALGVDETKLGVKSYGSAEYEQEKNQSISKNRRVEFQIYKN